MTIGELITITNNKKLMIKIDEQVKKFLLEKSISVAKKDKLPLDKCKLPVFTSEETGDHFLMLSLDKYDKANMSRFEKLRKEDIAFQGVFKSYNFTPDGETESLCGVNYVLIGNIRKMKASDMGEKPLL